MVLMVSKLIIPFLAIRSSAPYGHTGIIVYS
nr:MAG TPA: hypothetical protein [Bacteriophage sp.]